MIEQMCDDVLGFISPVRVYACHGQPLSHVMAVSSVLQWSTAAHRAVPEETPCLRCGYGPVLWDHWRQSTYVLTPYVLIEEEF